ncbi:Ger(x)C family spore germination protein [Paenibacillus sp. NFR01]|uniref:Ger(x)C family spore germination protein n=1 Tax=Paenibacillus sp. NFR01 TaxID=1566279 RepID=UPI0008BD75E6|nr:Ger(x)C family spore germination protein [Paenibacillus sp. NFR01]SET55201.1 spore germination protein KC [Paenibacillus sp. NFR01]
MGTKATARICALLCMMMALTLLTGCWNSRELNALSIVTGIGVDLEPETGDFKVSFQLVIPTSTSSGSGSGSVSPSSLIITAKDKTIFSALRRASKQVSRQLFFAHIQLLVIGEELARKGVDNIFDIFERSHELRLNSAVLVSRGLDAESVLKVLTPVESLPSFGLVNKAQISSSVWGENRRINVFDAIHAYIGEGDMTINAVSIKGDPEEGAKKKQLEQTEPLAVSSINGLGAFHNGKLTYWLNGAEARGTQWVLDKIEEAVVNVSAAEYGQPIAVNVYHSISDVKVKLKNGTPVFKVHIREEGSVSETEGFIDLSSQEEIAKLEKAFEKVTADEIMAAWKTAREHKSDIFGFGNELKRTNPQGWKKVEKNWEDYFASGEIELHIEGHIRSTGMRLKPYMKPSE